MRHRIERQWEDDSNFRILTFAVYGSISAYVPGQFSGPAEFCYPDEGREVTDLSVELISASICDDEGNEIRDLSDLSEDEKRSIEQQYLNKHESDLRETLEASNDH